ncbi:TolC family protein [Flavobacterium agricola]|uniref:TolC family protein n=1 Tax=Flavobacterium agricola TaxID=2870839 RepID=A0ABY6LVG3_9FLAO|nr:TolC family protein [Flavobacterium agricola]UYW00319.1 TolC family protein [Flavobacterium agricola]
MKKLNYLLVFICYNALAGSLWAQQFTVKDLEAQFLTTNATLIATNLEISKADAEIIQEKLWDNPNLSIAEVNFWTNSTLEEDVIPLIGKKGNPKQLHVELEQMIATAGKRKKRVTLKKLEKNDALYEYEELLRELKKELRQTFNSLNSITQQENQLQNIVAIYTQMSEQYERQAQLNNVPKVEYFRIQSELIDVEKDLIELQNEQLEHLQTLRVLTQNAKLQLNQLIFNSNNLQKLSTQVPLNILEVAKNGNIEIKKQTNEIHKAEKQLQLENAERIPDVALQVTYDRAGNIMRNFVGFGVAFDLPILNSNKGNRKAAKIAIEQEKLNQSAVEIELETTLDRLTNQLTSFENTLAKWPSAKLEEQQQMIANFKKHVLNKDVTLIEFIDFTQAYRDAQNAILELQVNYLNTFEELQYIVGKDF